MVKVTNERVRGITVNTPVNVRVHFDEEGVALCAPEVAESLRGVPGYRIGVAQEEPMALPAEASLKPAPEAEPAPEMTPEERTACIADLDLTAEEAPGMPEAEEMPQWLEGAPLGRPRAGIEAVVGASAEATFAAPPTESTEPDIGPPIPQEIRSVDAPPEHYADRLAWARLHGYKPRRARPLHTELDAWIADFLSKPEA